MEVTNELQEIIEILREMAEFIYERKDSTVILERLNMIDRKLTKRKREHDKTMKELLENAKRLENEFDESLADTKLMAKEFLDRKLRKGPRPKLPDVKNLEGVK